MRDAARCLAAAALVAATWVVAVLHMAVLPKPDSAPVAREAALARSVFLPRAAYGLNHLVLHGDAYERGLAAGRLTRGLIEQEETDLVRELARVFPSPWLRGGLLLGAMRWYAGVERFVSRRALSEMLGVSASAAARFDVLADGYTRQLAYHGVHEVGQTFVDFERQDFGCTLIAVPHAGGWVIGRNFDFEAVRLLDTEKIVKWAFPDDGGLAYVSVTWAGMVGVVTGVNERGVFVAINAAGSADVRRHGTPSTLVALEALETARTAREAVQVIERATVFISDLYTVGDRATGELYRVEKTPRRTRVVRLTGPAAVANHLQHQDFADDPVNAFRVREQTTVARWRRAQELALAWREDAADTAQATAEAMARLLRDKRGRGGVPLAVGHRSSIDALIATHAVIYDSAAPALWVSQGPALSGGFVGYDLARSFAAQRPVEIGRVGEDPDLSPARFAAVKAALERLEPARADLAAGRCVAAGSELDAVAASPAAGHYEYRMLRGDWLAACSGDQAAASASWRAALEAAPAYAREERKLREALR